MLCDSLGQAFLNGVVDRYVNFYALTEQRYRADKPNRGSATAFHRAAWRLGWEFAHLLDSSPSARWPKGYAPVRRRTSSARSS